MTVILQIESRVQTDQDSCLELHGYPKGWLSNLHLLDYCTSQDHTDHKGANIFPARASVDAFLQLASFHLNWSSSVGGKEQK